MTGSSQIRRKTPVMISITPVALFALIFLSEYVFFFCLASKFAFENCHTNKVARVIRTD